MKNSPINYGTIYENTPDHKNKLFNDQASKLRNRMHEHFGPGRRINSVKEFINYQQELIKYFESELISIPSSTESIIYNIFVTQNITLANLKLSEIEKGHFLNVIKEDEKIKKVTKKLYTN